MNITNIIMILIATGLTQYHGIQFWSGFVGATGWAWSITLEAAALWLWVRGSLKVWPLLASCLLLAGPLFHITWPVLQQSQQVAIVESARLASVSLLQDEIATLETALATSLKNSESRSGWLNDIQQSKQAMNVARSELSSLEAVRKPGDGFKPYIQAAMQALALITVWAVSVMALQSLTRGGVPVRIVASARTTPRQRPTPLETGKTITQQIAKALAEVLEREGLNQRQWAEKHGIAPKVVSMVCNHDRREEENKVTAAQKHIDKMAGLLAIKVLP